MGLLALGINHKTAPVNVREQVAFAPENMVQVLQHACAILQLNEIAILSTCNRTELYCNSELQGSRAVLEWLGEHHGLAVDELEACSYAYWDDEAIKHMMRVASGLDSMVLGEPQILGQIKSAYAVARDANTLGGHLEKLFQNTFSVAKQVRTETAIGENPVSVAYAAVSLAQHIFADMSRTKALLIGAGKTIDLVARHLQQNGVTDMVVANRTLQRAEELAANFGAQAVLLSDIPEQLRDADIVIASTASQLPILGKGAVERALKTRKHRPMYMVDIAVPRDIEPEVGELSDVYLYSVDDLKQVIDENLKSRQNAAQEAEAFVELGAFNMLREMRALDAVSTVKAYREQSADIRDIELGKALKQLDSGQDPQQVITQLARALTNKLVHSPCIEMKKASAEGRTEVMELAQQLFGLSDSDSNELDK
ncbi:MAG: glutamyl-tRNA reductase [Pseudomonadales bacterium]